MHEHKPNLLLKFKIFYELIVRALKHFMKENQVLVSEKPISHTATAFEEEGEDCLIDMPKI